MLKSSKYLIATTATIKDALVALDGASHEAQTLFVLDENERMVGTLTDGDIRRGIINGYLLTDKVSSIMHRDFKFLRNNYFDAKQLKSFRERLIYFIPVLDEKNHIVDVCNLIKYKTILPVDAVLMAGGKGERLRPLTENTPKPLLLVGNKSIIDHNIDRLISYGIKNISVTVNYLKEQIEQHYEKPRNNIKIHCCQEPKFLGTMGSVKFVEHFNNDVVLVMNSDLFTNINYEDFYLHFKENDADMSVAAVPYSIAVPYGIFDLDGRDVKGIVEKPTYNYYANAGIYLIKQEMLSFIPDDTFFNAPDLIDLLISKKKKVIRFPLNGTWIDIGNPQEYAKANELVKHFI